MPIFPIFANAAFGPELTKIMGEALDRAVESMRVAPSQISRESMANRIIEGARNGERDVAKLCDKALQGVGVAS